MQDEKCSGMGLRIRSPGKRGSERRTDGAVRRIRSPGTNAIPREEPRVRFSGYGHQEPTGFQRGRHDVSQL